MRVLRCVKSGLHAIQGRKDVWAMDSFILRKSKGGSVDKPISEAKPCLDKSMRCRGRGDSKVEVRCKGGNPGRRGLSCRSGTVH